MEKFKVFLKKVFFLKPLPTVLISVPSFVFVFIVLAMGINSPVAYIAYVLSAYAMIILCTGIKDICKAIKSGVDNNKLVRKICGIPIVKRYLGDVKFSSAISIYSGLLINLLYVGIKLFSGIYYRSVWFIALAFYYLVLAAMRFSLAKYIRFKKIGSDVKAEFHRYRICGILLVFMNIALIGIVAYIVHKNQNFIYTGILLYAMAIYAFYAMITAAINVFKFRRHGSPVMSAAKVINLTAAFVSMLSLETAMLAEYGADDLVLRKTMTSISGGIVCVTVLGMAVYMIIRSTKNLKSDDFNNSKTYE